MITLPDGTEASWLTESGEPEPAQLGPVDDSLRAAAALRRLRKGHTLLWTGDWNNGRQLLKAVDRRLRKAERQVGGSPATRWRAQRDATHRRAAILGRVVVALDPEGAVPLRRAPDTREAVRLAWGEAEGWRVVGLRTLVGALGAAGWTERGVEVPALDATVHPRFGVFSPTRQAYLSLVAGLEDVEGRSVLDVGCGTGVLAFVLLNRGASRAVGTDVEPRAVACATDNAVRLGLADRFEAVQGSLFAGQGRFDVVVFNAPWIPEPPVTRLDHAIYDEGGALLAGFLAGVGEHLTEGGRAVLILSDLPERLGLREEGAVEQAIAEAGLRGGVAQVVAASHAGAKDPSDPLVKARSEEQIRMWVLRG